MFSVLYCLAVQHDHRLVVLAAFVCFLTSLAAINLFTRARATTGKGQAAWLAAAAGATGSGIWATHFIAMLAYDPGVAVGYDIGLTALSLGIAILITGTGLTVAALAPPRYGPILGGALLGGGIACMHYLGMAAVELPAHISWSIRLVAASVFLGMLFGAAALAASVQTRRLGSMLGAALLLTMAIVSHHFTAMGAVEVLPDPAKAISGLSMSPGALSLAIAGVAIAVVAVSFAGAFADGRVKEQNIRLDAAISNMPQGLVMFDAAGRLVLHNTRYREMYRLPNEAVHTGCTLRDLVQLRKAAGTFAAADPDGYAQSVMSAIRRGDTLEDVVELTDGRTTFVRNQPMPGGGWVSTHEDITDLKRSEASFRLLFEANPLPMWVFDHETLRFIDVNQAAISHYGYSREQFLNMTLLDIRPAEDREEVSRLAGSPQARFNQGKTWRHQKADGSLIEVGVFSQPMTYNGRASSLAALVDMTERRHIERELDRNRAFLDTIIDNVPAGIVVKEPNELRFVLINRMVEGLWGISRADALGKTPAELFGQERAHAITLHDKRALTMNEPLQLEAHRNPARPGDPRIIASKRLAVRSPAGEPQYLITVVEDVTLQKKAESERDRNREFLDRVIENVPAIIFVKDTQGRYLLVNRSGEKLWGLGREQIIGKTAADIFPESTANMVRQHDQTLLAEDKLVFEEHPVHTPHNGTRWVTARRLCIRGADGAPEYLLGVLEDVTDRRAVEQQLRQAQKMEAVGNLTGGLAHDFNNLLMVMIGNLDFLAAEVAGDAETAETVDTVLQAALRGAELTRQMLAFARRQPLQPKNVDINQLLAGTMKMLSRTIGENVAIDVRTTDPLPLVHVDAAQLESAVVNIAINARDAMPNGGRLVIETALAEFDDAESPAPELGRGTYVVISLADNGTGMSQDVLSHIFEPFFTTKGQGVGTGLGLSMVYGFVKQSGGHVTAYSEVGHGTVFKLYLPAATAKIASANLPRISDAGSIAPGHETILAVDDDEKVRSLVASQLKELGYRVETAHSGEEALRKLEQHAAFDLLFTDVIMPGGMTGKELARRARELRPGLKILLTSGFPGAALSSTLAADGDLILPKPYRKRELGLKVREALDA